MRFPAPSEATPNAFNRGNVVERLIGTRVKDNMDMKLSQGSNSTDSTTQVPSLAAVLTSLSVLRLSMLLVHVDAKDLVNMSLTQQNHSTDTDDTTLTATTTALSEFNAYQLSIFFVHIDAGDNVSMKRTQQFQLAESTPAVVVSKQQPSTPAKKTKTHRVLMVFSQWGEQATLRILDVEATGIREAKALASDLLCRLEPDQHEAITVDPHDLGYDFSDPEILDVWKTRDIPGHAWTRAEVESEHFDARSEQGRGG